MQRTTSVRSHDMGDKKGKKDRAKENRQHDAKKSKAAKQKQAKRQTRIP